MASGRKTLREIEHSIRQLRQREQSLIDELEEENKRRAALLEKRTEAYRDLAEVRTRSAVADGVIDEADQIEHRVAGILKARQATIDTLKDRAVEADEKRDQLVDDADALVERLARLEERLDVVAAEAGEALRGDEAHANLIAARDKAKDVFEKADEKTRTAEQDRIDKGRAYESDPLFMYLWKRRYGREDYKTNTIIRMCDDWLAQYVRYHEARANYAVLIEIPERLRDHCNALKQEWDEAQDAVDASEAEKIRELAGTDLPGEIATARREQNALHTQLEIVDAEIAEISGQLTRYAQGRDASFREAVSISAEFLERERYEELLSEARSTEGREDDEIVADIGRIYGETKRLEKAVAGKRRELEKIADRRQDLLKTASKFRRAHYDDPGSIFMPDMDMDDLLEDFVEGLIEGSQYWRGSSRRHRWKGRPADAFRRRAGFPPFGSSKRRSGRSGGFRTGGGF